MQLTPELQEVANRLAAEGDALCEQGRFAEALKIFRKGLDAVPEPREQYGATMWFLAAIGDCQWFMKDYAAAADTFRDALLYGGIGNEFIHKRRGQTLYELGQLDEAANELLRAWLLGGNETFSEDGDAKYLQFVKARARPPAGRSNWDGWNGVEKSGPVYEWLTDPSAYELRPKPPKK